ncbi:uncharacterized protein K02A2.6-like [Rhipicephalus sanguineus]|uniref:uncharacterized protein K02A2.6-like n=1 Tax=Rhipicephalus sanguineus TaxID=34632 RepID=UPI0020C43561|nr:uncharacterized protein K02A2.6-like [Rhipicephalus sanguineus]
MKMLARSHVWWPRLTLDIEQAVKEYITCQLSQNAAARVPLMPWGWPTRRWQRVHLDFAQRDQHFFLVLMDAHSKWVEVFVMTTTTSEKTVEKLRGVFAAYGLPEEIVTDNGPQFTSQHFATFLSRNGIRHSKSPPYHPVSNGSAERCVQTVKKDLFKQILDEERKGDKKSMQHRIDQFLFSYRNTPSSTTGETPAQIFLSWQPRTRLSLLHPDMEQRMREKGEQAKLHADQKRGPWRDFSEGDQVLVKGLRPDDDKWLLGSRQHTDDYKAIEVHIKLAKPTDKTAFSAAPSCLACIKAFVREEVARQLSLITSLPERSTPLIPHYNTSYKVKCLRSLHQSGHHQSPHY